MRLTGSDLDRLMHEAVEALKGPSPVLERIPKMSKEEIQTQIDERIDLICSGNLTGTDLEQVRAEAQTLAVIRLRRG